MSACHHLFTLWIHVLDDISSAIVVIFAIHLEHQWWNSTIIIVVSVWIWIPMKMKSSTPIPQRGKTWCPRQERKHISFLTTAIVVIFVVYLVQPCWNCITMNMDINDDEVINLMPREKWCPRQQGKKILFWMSCPGCPLSYFVVIFVIYFVMKLYHHLYSI